MRLTVSTGFLRRRALPGFGIAALVIAALTVLVTSALAPDGSAWWITALAAVGGFAAGFVLEYLAGRALEMRARRLQIAKAIEGLRAQAPQGLATLLSAHRASEIGLPLLGRDTELAKLLDWCTGSGKSFRLITGPGGVGKTRLADELCRQLQSGDQHWVALFLGAGRSAEPGAVSALREHAGDQPVLIVVDYADSRPDLREFLEDGFKDPGTLRILMLARQAGNWWDELTDAPGGLGGALAVGYHGRDLAPVEAGQQVIVDSAAAAFAAHLEVPIPQVRVDSTERLRVLDLTVIALVAVLSFLDDPGSRIRTGRVGIEQVFTELLRHEADRYWRATATEAGLERVLTIAMRRVLVAAVALLGAVDKPSTVALVGRALGTFTDEVLPDVASVARWLRKTYPATGEAGQWVTPLAPDRLAEHLVVETLIAGDRPVQLRVTALLEGLSDDQAVHAMTVLSRAATDPAREDGQRRMIRALADHLADHLPPSHATVGDVLAVVPWPSVTMRSTAMALARKQLTLLEDASDADEEAVAIATHHLASWLSVLGRSDEALSATQRAVGLYERLVQINPDNRVQLAAALLNLGVWYADMEQPDEALHVTARAVDLYEQLAAAEPDQYEHQLAAGLSNLGGQLSELGRLDDALLVTQRAVDLFERQAQSHPDHYEPDLVASSLDSLGRRYSELKRPGEALSATQRAVNIYEELAQSNPDRYEPDLAGVLAQLGLRLSERLRPYEGVLAAQRAVSLFEGLARNNPERYEGDLASALDSLGTYFLEVLRPHEAMQATQRAVRLYEQLAQTDTERHEPNLAGALNHLMMRFSDLGWPDEALSTVQRAVKLYGQLAQTDAERHEPNLAGALNNLAHQLWEQGRTDEAMLTIEQAIDLYERAARRGSRHYQADHHQHARAFLNGLLRDSD
jgi:tetratricopeptide (TPR) repeat protein